jgi:serine/threonine-protein kinase
MDDVVNWLVGSTKSRVAVFKDPGSPPLAVIFPLRWAIGSIFVMGILAAAALFLWIQYWPLLSARPQQANEGERILRYVSSYDGGGCFLATPVKRVSGEIEIIGYGNNISPFDALKEAFTSKFRREPKMYFQKIVSADQCATLAFVGQLPPNNDDEPRFEIKKTNLANGDVLEGLLLTRAPYVALLIVDDQGLAHGVSDRLKRGTNSQMFSIGPLEDSDPKVSKQYILVGIASVAPISALKFTKPRSSNEVLSLALAQTRLLDQPASATMVLIRMN